MRKGARTRDRRPNPGSPGSVIGAGAPQFSWKRSRFGFSFVELIVALVISATFLGALYTSFIGMLRAADRAEARMEAVRNARTAISTMTDELKAIQQTGSQILLTGTNLPLTFGDGFDNDGDGKRDEEIFDGRDNDGDWDPETDDLHARIDGGDEPIFDRFTFTVQDRFQAFYGSQGDDLGDFHVDEDVVFSRDSLTFRILPPPEETSFTSITISYRVETSFDGQLNVLVREEIKSIPTLAEEPERTLAPLAFQVLSLDFLYWDPNGVPDVGAPRTLRPYWVESWDSSSVGGGILDFFQLPAAIFIRVTVYADRRPFETYVPGQEVETLSMNMIVNLEGIIGSAAYQRPDL